MNAAPDLDVNNNEVDNTIGLRLTRAETDLTSELKRLNMEDPSLTSGIPLRRCPKTLNFPSHINFNEMGLGDGSSIDLNGKFGKTLIKQVVPIPRKAPMTELCACPRSRESSFTVLNANATTPPFFSQPSQFDQSSKYESIGRTIPSELYWRAVTFTSYTATRSDIDKSKGDGSGPSFAPKKFQDGDHKPWKGDIEYTDLNFNSTIPEEMPEEDTSIPYPEMSEVAPTSSQPSIDHFTDTEIQPSEPEQENNEDDVEDDSGPIVEKTSDKRSNSISTTKSGSNSSKTSDRRSSESSSSKSETSSSKSETSSSKSETSSSKEESEEVTPEVTPAVDEKRGAIIFKVPGRLTHKTTIKVSHFPGNVKPCSTPDQATSASAPPNTTSTPMEFIVEDIVPQPQMPNYSCSPESQMLAQMQQQQMLAYQQYYCGQGMYCNPYSYPYPYRHY